jgi:hypothetical protein
MNKMISHKLAAGLIISLILFRALNASAGVGNSCLTLNWNGFSSNPDSIYVDACLTTHRHPVFWDKGPYSILFDTDAIHLGYGEKAKEHNDFPQSMASYDTEECRHLDNISGYLEGPGTYQEGYDTTKKFLTLCYDMRGSEGAFDEMEADNDFRINDLSRFAEFREWLKSVLYLRMDSMWYCSDVTSILSTCSYFPEHGDSVYASATIAIVNYIIEHNRCDSAFFMTYKNEALSWDSIYNSHDPIPSIDDIGLAILRGPLQAVHPSPMGGNIEGEELANLHVTENPFDNSTQVAFTLNDYGLVVFQLYDDLGKLQTSNGIGQVLYPGEHAFDIDGTKLASGVYYARISYHNGGVKTVMVRKR